MIVVDTNIIAYLLIAGPETENCKEVLHCDPDWRVPFLWRSEFGNVLVQHARHGYLPTEGLEEYMRKARILLRGGEASADMLETLRLAAMSECSFYDCEFVALAQSLKCPLVTSDRKIRKAFPAHAVSPGDFLQRRQAHIP